MKKFLITSVTTIFVLACALLLQGCLKDTVTRTYAIYTPVYKTTVEVRANIKSGTPVAVKSPGKMFVSGKYIFLNETNKGIHIIDNSDPSAPVNKYFIDIPGNLDMAVTGNTLYADLYTDLLTLDISDPTAVKIKKITENVFPFRRYSNGFVARQNEVIIDWVKKDTTITSDINSLPDNREFLVFDAVSLQSASFNAAFKAATGISGSMARFTLLNNYLYTVTDNALNAFNISQPQNPVFSNTVNVAWGVETIYPFKNNLFIGSQSGMFVYGTTNPAQPVQSGSFSHARVCDPVIADDNYAYVTLRSGSTCQGFINQLDIIDIQNLSNTKLVKSYPLTNPHGLSKYGDVLFICDGAAGLKVFDATNVNNIRLLQTVSGMDAYDVITVNGIVIVVAKDGLYQYEFRGDNTLQPLSKILYS